MMSDLEVLNKLIKKDRRVEPKQTSDNTYAVTLKENEENGKYEVAVEGLRSNAVVLKADELSCLQQFLNPDKGCCRCADYILVSNGTIVFIELKASFQEGRNITQQLKGAKCLMDYFAAIGREFYEQSKFLCNFERRFVLIEKINIGKTATKAGRSSSLSGDGKSPAAVLRLRGGNKRRFSFSQFCYQ